MELLAALDSQRGHVLAVGYSWAERVGIAPRLAGRLEATPSFSVRATDAEALFRPCESG
jgi:hypothetical protein